MISLLQLLVIGCAISVIWLNENLHNSSIMTLMEQSENFGQLYRKVLIAFYSVSILTSVIGLLSPLTVDAVDGVNPILNAYRVLGCVHVVTLGANFGLHLTLYIKSEQVLEAVDVQALYERGGVSKEISQAINLMQRNHKCCGLFKPADWDKLLWWTDNTTALYSHKIPKSCCSVKQCTYAAKLSTKLTAHKVGCRKKIYQELLVFLRYNWIFPLSILVAQIIVIILAFILIRLMKYTAEELAENDDDEKMFFTKKRLAKLRKQTRKKFWKILKSESESDEEDGKRRRDQDDDDDDDYREKRRKKLLKKLKRKKLKRERKRKKETAEDDDLGSEKEVDRAESRKKKIKETDEKERFYPKDRERDAVKKFKDRGETEYEKESKVSRRDREPRQARDRGRDYYEARERVYDREKDKLDRRDKERERFERRDAWEDRERDRQDEKEKRRIMYERDRQDKKEKRRTMYEREQRHLSNYPNEDFNRRDQTPARDFDFRRSDTLRDPMLEQRYQKILPKERDQYETPYRKSEKSYDEGMYYGPDTRSRNEEFQRKKPAEAGNYYDDFAETEKQRLDIRSNQILDTLTAAEIANVTSRENGKRLKVREDRLKRLKRRQIDELRRLKRLSAEENLEMEKIKELSSTIDPDIPPPIMVQPAANPYVPVYPPPVPMPNDPRTTVLVSVAPTSEKVIASTLIPVSNVNLISNKPSGEVSSGIINSPVKTNVSVKSVASTATSSAVSTSATVATTAPPAATTTSTAAITATSAATATTTAAKTASTTAPSTAITNATATASNRKYSRGLVK